MPGTFHGTRQLQGHALEAVRHVYGNMPMVLNFSKDRWTDLKQGA